MSLLLSDADVRQAMSYPDLADGIEAADIDLGDH